MSTNVTVREVAPAGEAVLYRTYSRKDVVGKRENWSQLSTRSTGGLQVLGRLTKEETALIFNATASKTMMPSGRWLWVGGTRWIEEPRNFSGAYNCTSTDIVDIKALALMMDLAMMGCGTGAVLEYQSVEQLPPVCNRLEISMLGTPGDTRAAMRMPATTLESSPVIVYGDCDLSLRMVVGDSRHGWVNSFLAMLELATDATLGDATIRLEVVMSNVRPQGEPVKGFGGVANPVKLPALSGGRLPVVLPPGSVGLTDDELRATAVPVSGPLTDGQLRASPITVDTGGLTDAELRAAAVPVSGPLSDTQLRAAAVPVSGTVGISGTVPVSGTVATGGLTDTELRASAVPVSAASLPLPADAATQTTLAALNAKIPAAPATEGGNLAGIREDLGTDDTTPPPLPGGSTGVRGWLRYMTSLWPSLVSGRWPVDGSGVTQPVSGPLTDAQLRASSIPVSPLAPSFLRIGFAEVGNLALYGRAAELLTLRQSGTGASISQVGGNLVITTGTFVNAETVIRSNNPVSGSVLARMRATLSQRIVNNTFRFELADSIGDALSFTINSATSVTVTFPSVNPFTAVNIGQSLRVSTIAGAVGIPGRFAIASVSGLSINLTVAGWPVSGSGTLSLYGWNAIWVEYSGTTATNATFDAARRGWASGGTVATINNTAAPGHVVQISNMAQASGLSDALVASNTGYQWTNRASRLENIPDIDVPLYLFIVVQNGTTTPASSTTFTVSFLDIEGLPNQKVRIGGSDPVATQALPVQVMGGSLATQNVAGTVTANQGTMAALPAGTNAIGDVGIQYRASSTGAGTITPLNCPATPAAQSIKGSPGRLLGLYLVNTNVTIRYIKFFNSASPLLASATAAMRIPLPQNQPVFINFEGGMLFGGAISCAITSSASITDSTGTVTLDDVTGFCVHA